MKMQAIQKRDISVRYPLIIELTRKQNLIEMNIWTQDDEYEPNFIVFENSKIGVVAKHIPSLTYIEEQDYILINILDKNSLNNKKLRSAPLPKAPYHLEPNADDFFKNNK